MTNQLTLKESHFNIKTPHKTFPGKLASLYFTLGSGLIIAAFSTLLLDVVFLAIGGKMGAWQWGGGILTAALYIAWQQKPLTRSQLRPIVGTLVLFLGILGASIAASGLFYDTSWDGQTYHQEAVIQLSQGWNPFYSKSQNIGGHSIWLDHYAKAHWILAANLYLATSHIEMAKAFNVIYFLASFLLCAACLGSVTALKPGPVYLTSGILAANPVVTSQLFNFTIDGQLGSLLLCLGSALISIAAEPSRFKKWSAVLLPAIALAVNIKFTAVVYVSILVFGFLTWIWISHRQSFIKLLCITGLWLLSSIFLFGFNPYITNILGNGHPFYPLAGQGKVDIIQAQKPLNFVGKSSAENLIHSIFSTSDATLQATAELKLPLTIKRQEFPAMAGDPRVGGFGPLFSGAICLSLAILGLQFVKQFDWKYLFVPGVLLASVLINPESWWARYVPQLWFLPALAIVLSAHQIRQPSSLKKVTRLCHQGLVLVLVANCALGTVSPLYLALRGSLAVSKEVKTLPAGADIQAIASFNTFRGNRSRFIEKGVKWQEVVSDQDLPCSQPAKFFKSGTKYCITSTS